jgi:hypothetical protein
VTNGDAGWGNGGFILGTETQFYLINPLNAELIPICHLLALLGAHPILHVSRIRVKYEQTQHFVAL